MRLAHALKKHGHDGFQSTHPVWDATLIVKRRFLVIGVSIHAPRMGCDFPYGVDVLISSFNPRTPYGMRLSHFPGYPSREAFQSTHPVWDATEPSAALGSSIQFQSTHPVWDATRHHQRRRGLVGVSIHAPRMGCDRRHHPSNARQLGFNPRTPYGMRLFNSSSDNIHGRFNPRTPYGMRPKAASALSQLEMFQSTHPVWDATKKSASGETGPHGFNPRTPYGMRLPATAEHRWFFRFQSTHPVWDATLFPQGILDRLQFQSTHPVWDATAWKLTVDGQWCSCRFAPTCSSCCYFQVRSFYSNDVNVLNSRLYENRRSAGNFL